MYRIVLCLPLCLFAGAERPDTPPALSVADVVVRADASKDNAGKAADLAEMERLARTDPIALLEHCRGQYDRTVKTGYTLLFHKQENIGGKINPSEVIEVAFREKPFSVLFRWQDGARLADSCLYVESENDGKMLARPRGGLARLVAGEVVRRDVDGADAKQSGRYTLSQFGLKNGLERTLRAWTKAREEGQFGVEYLGVKTVKEIGDRPCLVLRRIAKVLENDIKETTIYLDTQTGFQVGIVQKDDKGLLIGSYYFRDIVLNPAFKKDQFAAAALKNNP